MIHALRDIFHLWLETERTLKRFREQKRMIINLLELFGEPALLPAEHDWPFKGLRGEPDPAATIAAASIQNKPFRTEFLQTALQGVLGNCRFSRDPAETGRLTTDSLEAKV
jgi:hypothetical protein